MNKVLKLLAFAFLFGAQFADAQKNLTTKNRAAIKSYELAIDHFSNGRLTPAIDALYEAIRRDDKFIEPYLVLGDIYNSTGDYNRELDALMKAYQIDSLFFPATMYNIGVASVRVGRFKEAVEWLEKYKWKYSDKRNAEELNKWLDRARFAAHAVENAYEINLEPAGEPLHPDYDEYWPSVTADEQTLIITVLKPRDEQLFMEKELPKSALFFQEDFFYSYRDDNGNWSRRFALEGDINTDGNEGAQSLSADGNMMFFTACGRSDGRGSCDIYFSRKTGSGWSAPVNLGMPLNTPYWESQPSFSSDGKTLYFVSNRPGGRGDKDIWMATIEKYNPEGIPIFGSPVNLGANINTTGEENSPFIHHDNKTLYFSSDGHGGMGEQDIFFSRRNSDGEWQMPVNVGYPINTQGDEMGFIVNARGDRAYFSSDGMMEGRKNKVIYTFELPEPIRPDPVSYVKGRVFDIETGETLPADFELKNLGNGKTVVESRSNQSGQFLVCLPLGGRYAFKAAHPGYMFYSGHFDLENEYSVFKPYQLDIGLYPIRTGAKTTLENIFFETDSYELKEESLVELEGLYSFLRDNPEVRILIGGHTDNQGNAAYNQRLSENRAKSVYNHLVNRGIDAKRLEYKGFGLSMPVADNSTPEGRARNRRTEVTIL
ncbi:OmpA family protein [Xiashengella succiniciproducens]|jgi:outer membrane protein OmpA-like peptidoglycan-associated protein|uniref:OmpA family protein n=1 Tax=Xiashengella succiniciproducens TaxID=2949635 RepID=A0A9J6ZN28_9BACT|nr:OmpA family protein [Alkaliflexus sp. Ai-910]URW78672.1 OmpA family protein [Alkaliflexus sp. Ai-910]